MRLTRHNGRSGKDGTYNPKHNDRSFDVRNSEHIDEERAKQNIYWDCYQGYHFPKDREQEDEVTLSFERVEQIFYENQYGDYCDAQHERNRKNGHSERDRSPDDLRLHKKTCPEETVIQIGTMEKSVDPGVLLQIATEFFEEFNRRFGEHVHILNWALHMDESTPHIQERHVFDCKNRYGETAPQQEKALEVLGFELPYPDKRPGKTNNRKITFDAACREILFDIALEHGLHLDKEPEYGGRAYLEKQDYILMKQKEKLKLQEDMIEEKEIRLNDITVRIENAEAFADEVADIAYENAVNAVSKIVRDETRNEDFKLIAGFRESVIKDPKFGDGARRFAGKLLGDLMHKFNGLTKQISEILVKTFRNPKVKEEVTVPVRESVLKALRQNRALIDSQESEPVKDISKTKNRNKDMER